MTVAGDSLALGIGATDSSRGFAFDLYRRIARERPLSEVTNVAIGGTTAADVSRLELPRLASTKPDLLVLEAGANDAVRRHDAAGFDRDFRGLVRAIRTAVPNAKLVIFNVPDVSVSPIFEDASKPALHRLVVAYNVSVADAAREAGATVVDLYHTSERARGGDDRFLSSDLFHPSDAGHQAIADAAWPAIAHVVSGIR